jgi:hypothetical protein
VDNEELVMTPEGKLKAAVKAYLDEHGAYYFMPVQMGFGASTVDFLCCVQGRFVAIETKIWPRRATQRQLDCIKKVQNAGGIGFVAYELAAVHVYLKPLLHPPLRVLP